MEFMIKKIRDLCRERKLQVDIVTVFLLLISCTTLLIISYSYSKTKKSILQFSKSTIQRTNTLILEKVSCRVESSDKLPKTIAAKINDLSEISFKNQDLVAYLKNLTKVYSDLTSFYVGSIDGNVLTSFNLRALNQKTYAINKDKPLPDNIYYALQIVERQSPESYEEYIYYDKDFKLIDSEKSSQISFNPITRPWFFKDIKPKEVRWTKIYTYDINQTLATTVTAGVFDKQGKLIGIAAADLSLDNFSSFLKEQKISTHGLAVILDKETGKVIIPLTFSEEKHPFITDKVIDEGLKSFNSQSNEDLVFEVDGKDYLGGFSTFPLSINDNWLIAVIAPLSDFFSSIIKVQHQVLLISACIFLIAGIFVFIFSKRISKPISILANEIDKIKNFELDSNIRISSNIFEISVLDRSIVAMRSALRSFSKYVPKEIVKELIRKGKDIALGGEKKNITIMFTDIVGFTNISEKLQPDVLMPLLSDYFDDLSKVILSKQGTIDKYIGDSIMALWGATTSLENPWERACSAALYCHQHSEKINNLRRQNHLPVFTTKFGIDSGGAIVGNIGTNERINFTAIGDVVNTASRLQSITTMYHCYIVISENVYENVKDIFLTRPLGEVSIKGKEKKIKVHELIAKKTPGEEISATEEQLNLSILFCRAVTNFENARFQDCLSDLEDLLTKFPDDEPSKLLKLKVEALLKT